MFDSGGGHTHRRHDYRRKRKCERQCANHHQTTFFIHSFPDFYYFFVSVPLKLIHYLSSTCLWMWICFVIVLCYFGLDRSLHCLIVTAVSDSGKRGKFTSHLFWVWWDLGGRSGQVENCCTYGVLLQSFCHRVWGIRLNFTWSCPRYNPSSTCQVVFQITRCQVFTGSLLSVVGLCVSWHGLSKLLRFDMIVRWYLLHASFICGYITHVARSLADVSHPPPARYVQMLTPHLHTRLWPDSTRSVLH